MIPANTKYENRTINLNSSGTKFLMTMPQSGFVAFHCYYRQDGSTLPAAWGRFAQSDGIYGSDYQYISIWAGQYTSNLSFFPKGTRIYYAAPRGDRVTGRFHIWYVDALIGYSEQYQ